jgi:hypothetical protein
MAEQEGHVPSGSEEKVVVVKEEPLPVRYVKFEDYQEPDYVEISESSGSDDDIEVMELKEKEAADFMRRMKKETGWRGETSPFIAALKGEIGPVPDPITAGLREQVEREVRTGCTTVRNLISLISKQTLKRLKRMNRIAGGCDVAKIERR